MSILLLFETRLDKFWRVRFFVADMVIRFGRYGLFVWPMWLWPIWFVADMVVANMVCGRYGTDPIQSVLRQLAGVGF